MPRLHHLRPPRPWLPPHKLELEYRPPHPSPDRVLPCDIVDLPSFIDMHRWADVKICNYIARPRASSTRWAHPQTHATLHPHFGPELYANNAEARIAFAEIALNHIRAHGGIAAGPLCFVTITPAICARPVGDRKSIFRQIDAAHRIAGPAAAFEVRRIRHIALEAMGAVPFIGMVELALYRLWKPGGPATGDWVSWHCHLLAWGTDQRALSRRLAPLRERHASMRDGVASAHVKSVEYDDVERQFLYALKAPQKLSRVNENKEPWENPATGEIIPPGLHTQKDWLRTGDRIRCADIMGLRRLPELLFGGLDGTHLVRAIRAEAWAPVIAWERSQHPQWRH